MPGANEAIQTERPWHWEGHVQAALVRHLESEGWRVEATADTAAREPGKDVVATDPEGAAWWFTVKGFPEKSVHAQARHWFAGALLDVVLYRAESPDARIGLALPAGFRTYRALVERARWLARAAPFEVFWVAQDGAVERGA